MTADEVLQRATNLAAWAEDLINEEWLLDNRPSEPSKEFEVAEVKGAPVAASPASDADEERWLIETTMEVVRIAERAVTHQAALKAKHSEAGFASIANDSTTEASLNYRSDSAAVPPSDQTSVAHRTDGSEVSKSNPTEDSTVNHPQTPRTLGSTKTPQFDANIYLAESAIRREQSPHSEHRSHLDTTRSTVSAGGNRPREEALHYLLRHLKGIQEKAQKQ